MSEGTSTAETVDINSSSGDNATLTAATTSRAGLMNSAKFNEIVLNNAKPSAATISSTYLKVASNLSDLQSVSDARDNLGLGTAALLDTGTGEGDIGVLGASGKYDISLLPSVTINTVYSVADIAERDALSPNEGDTCVVTDDGTGVSRTYIFDGTDWIELTSGGGGVSSVNGKSGTVVLNKTDIGLSNVSNDAQLTIANNLSDLANKATARTNLELGTAALLNTGVAVNNLIKLGAGGALTINDLIKETNLAIEDGDGTNGQVLTKNSAKSGGLE